MKLQVAYDYTSVPEALYTYTQILHAHPNTPDLYHEIGTPLLKHGGRPLVSIFAYGVRKNGGKLIVDSKTVDVADQECEGFYEDGADMVTCMAFSTDANIQEALRVAKRHNAEVLFDLDSAQSLDGKGQRAEEILNLGARYINCHTGISQQISRGENPFQLLSQVHQRLRHHPEARLVVAGGINRHNIQKLEPYAEKIGIVIIGSGITRAPDPVAETNLLLNTIRRA